MKSLFRCTVCGAALTREEKNYRCPNGHCFDIAKEGYTYLLPVNQRHSKSPGDDKAMTAARSAFLNKGYYEFLRNALCDIALTYTRHAPAVLDVGCGEGYYTSAIWSILANAGKEPRMAGIDISKDMARRAAKQVKRAEIAVASAYHLPLGDGTVDLLLCDHRPCAGSDHPALSGGYSGAVRHDALLLENAPGGQGASGGAGQPDHHRRL